MPKFTLEDGAKLHYEERGAEHGTGRPILFLHGVWMSGRFFKKQLSALGKNHRVIALDFRGHGRSSRVPRGHTMGQYARDVRAFIQGMGLRGVVLAGWSMGTFVVLDYFQQFGAENVKAAVMVEESTSDYKWPDWPIGFIDFASLCQMMRDVQTDREAFARAFIDLMFKEKPGEKDVAWMLREICRPDEAIAGAVLFDQTVQDYRPALPKVTVPTLLCFGRDEKIIPVAAGEYLRDHLANAKLVIFEKSSHCPFLEEPRRFNREVEAFVSGLI